MQFYFVFRTICTMFMVSILRIANISRISNTTPSAPSPKSPPTNNSPRAIGRKCPSEPRAPPGHNLLFITSQDHLSVEKHVIPILGGCPVQIFCSNIRGVLKIFHSYIRGAVKIAYSNIRGAVNI